MHAQAENGRLCNCCGSVDPLMFQVKAAVNETSHSRDHQVRMVVIVIYHNLKDWNESKGKYTFWLHQVDHCWPM